MSRDLLFFGGVVVLTLAVFGWLLGAPPFAEAQADLGVYWGWGMALIAIVPSYVLLSRSVGDDDVHRFHRAFMLGTMGRFLVCLGGTVVFHFSVADAPFKTFLLAFFLGWLLLTGLELSLVLRQGAATRAQRSSAGPNTVLNEEHA